MDSQRKRRAVISTLVAAPLAIGLAAAPTASATTDVNPPTPPTELRTVGSFGGQPVLTWNPSTDDSGAIDWYSIRVDGSQARRDLEQQRILRVYDLLQFDHVVRGHTYTITIVAFDEAGNRSAPSNPVRVTVV
ncbi:fibronectin type III domain-containing protein [Amycolatopsis anabasis]|uniref:fibronectin type III domain-containing protein n=1 Tax=Amycolatopsis anabasis TaxID=1840409 RepID=UPI00131AF3DB|nr:fibronectin type III domain-containing protein [Amycolatopsis anabasis]